MAGKSFKRAVANEDVWFGLPGPDGDEVRFNCVKVLPAGVILDFGALLSGGDESDSAGNVPQALTNLLREAIVEEQYSLFQEMLHDRRCEIGIQMLSDVASFLAEQYSGGRPTGPSSADTSPRTESGNGSTDGVLREVATYSRSGPVGLTR